MPSNFISMTRELSGTIPKLSDLLAGNLVNQAWAQLRDTRKWSWLVAEGSYFVPSVLTGGTVQVTQFSPQVVADSFAGSLLEAAVFATPPLIQRQFRASNGGPIYNIASYDPNARILTLERPYLEQSSTAFTTWAVYELYYPAPSQDFLKYLSILNPVMGYSITEDRCTLSKEELDRKDPQRGAQGDPYYVAFYRTDPVSQLPVYEFWPSPTNSYGLPFIYQRRGEDFVNPDDALPPTIESYSFMQLAHYHGCMWAAKNAGRYPELKGVNWLAIATGHLKVYEAWLQKAKIADDEIFLKSWTLPWRLNGAQIGPLDAAFAQSHDMEF